MSKKLFFLFGIVIFLAGCRQEPMIQLSEENQQLVESKRQMQQSGESTSEEGVTEEKIGPEETTLSSEEGVASFSQAQTQSSEESMIDETEDESDNIALVELDKSDWEIQEEPVSLTLTDFLPSVPYQIKEFTNGQSTLVTYPTYVDQNQTMMQIMLQQNGELQLEFYDWGQSQVVQVEANDVGNPYVNQLSQANFSNNQLVLQAPLQVGSSWQRNTGLVSEITAIYATATLPAGEFEQVIEVTTDTTVDYYAAGEGHIARETANEIWLLAANNHQNRIINEIDVTYPNNDETELLMPGEARFRWQTNGSLASSFTDLFREMNIIDDSITIQNVTVQNDVVTVDFTPGVVAVLNNYDASELAVVAAIVTTAGNFFDQNQVRLTVNGNGMLPNTVPYPPNGIYLVDTIQDTEITESIESDTTETNATSEAAQALPDETTDAPSTTEGNPVQ